MPNEEKPSWSIGRCFEAVCPCCKAYLRLEVDFGFAEKIPDPIKADLQIKTDPYRPGNLLARIINASERAKSKLNALAPHLEFVKDILTEVIAANEQLLEKKVEEDAQG